MITERIRELYQIAADACKAVIDHGKKWSAWTDYDQIFRDLENQTYNEETIFRVRQLRSQILALPSAVVTGYT